MDAHLLASVPVPAVSAPGSASAAPPAAGNPLLEGVQSAERGLRGVTVLCRSSSRLAHLVKVPGRPHLQTRAQRPGGGTDYLDPREEGGKAGPPQPRQPHLPTFSSSCRWPQASVLACSPPALASWCSGSPLPPYCHGPGPAAPGPPDLSTRVEWPNVWSKQFPHGHSLSSSGCISKISHRMKP